MANYCPRCGVKEGFVVGFALDSNSNKYHCAKCIDAILEEKRAAKEVEKRYEEGRTHRLLRNSRKVVLTTTPNIDGYRITKYLGIESVEFVIGTGVFSEVGSSIADFFGLRSTAFEKKLRAAKQHAQDALKFVAAEKGANAVVAVDLDYTEFSGNRIALIINGTLVVAEPLQLVE